MEMNTKTEGIMAVVAAFLVLISALLAPVVSAVVSITLLALFGIWKLVSKEK
jgi:integral membrane sensor domain MASE1